MEQLSIKLVPLQQQLIIQTMAHCEQIVSFLTKFTISYVDPHTTIITQLLPQHPPSMGSSFDFLNAQHQDAHKMSHSKMPACYLIKDMIIDDDSEQDPSKESVLKSVMQTLSIHQQLSNKYILTLIHHQVFIKTIASNQSTLKSNQASVKKQVPHLRQKHSECSFSEYEPGYQYEESQQQISQHNMSHGNSKLKENNSVTKLHHDDTVVSESRTAIRAIYEYGKLTLKEQIGNRIASSTQFEEEELWAILATIVQALGYLEEEGIVYGVLGTDKIFINDSLVKILDPSATATDPLLITEGRLYSPEILNDQENINMFKSDIYITGLVILECGLLLDLSKEIEPDLAKYIGNFKQVYSKQLVDILEMCLQTNPDQRPSFQELKKYLAKELDMNDFEGAYDTQGMKLLKPIGIDVEDACNDCVPEIEYEYEQCLCDILYESIGEDQLQQNRRKNITQYERAKLRYLGVQGSSAQSPRQSSRTGERNSNSNQRIYSQQHRQRASSPSTETRRNNKQIVGNQNYPKIVNMALSESVYANEFMPITNKNADKTNRKLNRPDQNTDYYSKANNNQLAEFKQNVNYCQDRTVPNSNQKIKKTKLIKQKLVRNCDQQQSVDHTFGAVKKHATLKSVRSSEPLRTIINEDRNRCEKNSKYENCGGSIQEEVDQQSESSYLYYNTTGSSKVSKKQQPNNADSQVSRKSENISSLRSSGMAKSGSRYQNCEPNQMKSTKSRPELKTEQIYTDPQLMQIIQEDLFRISTTKNIPSTVKQTRWYK